MSNSANSSWRTVARPLWKFLAASIRSNSSRGSGSAGVDVRGHVRQHVPFPAEILHELARQLDRVPFDALDAGDAGDVDLGQQLMQAVAELVEQRDDVVVRERRGLAARDGRRQVAREVGDRMLHAARRRGGG